MLEPLEYRIAPAALIAIDDLNHLLRFDSNSPGTVESSVDVTGMQSDEIIAGIDFRPARNQLYALSSANRLYQINVNTGAATLATTLDADVTGQVNGLDFDPVTDRLRIVNEADENFTVIPETGITTAQAPLSYQPTDINAGRDPTIVAVASTNPDNDPQTDSLLFGLDVTLDILVSQKPVADGTLRTVGPLGIGASGGVVGFDIGRNDRAFASFITNAGAILYEIDLSTGTATALGAIGEGHVAVRNLAVVPSGFSAVRTGETATFFGTADADLLHLTVTRGGLPDFAVELLRHNGFSKGSPGFESSTDFDSSAPGVQTLSATGGSTIVANLGGGDDVLRIGSPDLFFATLPGPPSAQEIDALITFNGGVGDDQLVFNNHAGGGAPILIDDDQVQFSTAGASTIYHDVERVDVIAGRNAANTITIESTAAGVITTVDVRGPPLPHSSSADTINLVPGGSDLGTRLQGQLVLIGSLDSGGSKIVADDLTAIDDHTYDIGSGTFSRDGTALFSHLGFDAITLLAGSGDDMINARSFAGYAIVDGGSGTDQIIGAQARIDDQSFIYRDRDGDRVTLVTTAAAGFEHSDFDLIFRGRKGGAHLRIINLSDDGADFQRASLTFSVLQRGTGDGVVEVGFINATNVDLGVVKLAGDLGQINAGDSDLTTVGVARLKVASLHDLGFDSQGPGLETKIVGGLDVLRARDHIGAAIVLVSGSIGRITVLGSLFGGGSLQNGRGSGSIHATGDIGSAYFGGSLVGGSTLGSGSIFASSIGSIFVGGDVRGGPTDVLNPGSDTGTINATGNIGKVTVKGDLVGQVGSYSIDSGSHSGSIFAEGDIGTIDTLQNLRGGVRIEGSIIGGDGITGIVSSSGTISKVRVLGDVSGAPFSRPVISALGRSSPTGNLAIGLIDIRGTLANAQILAGHNADDSDLPVNGDAQIGTVTIGRDLIASDIVAGAHPGADRKFGTADDVAGASISDEVSGIGSIVINGRANGTAGEPNDHFGFVAQLIGSVLIQGEGVPLTPGPSNDTSATNPDLLIAPTGDVRVKEV